MGTAGDFAELGATKEEKLNATQTRALVSVASYWIPDWIHPAVFQAAARTEGSVYLDRTIEILPVRPTIGAASRRNHDDVFGGGAEKLRKGR